MPTPPATRPERDRAESFPAPRAQSDHTTLLPHQLQRTVTRLRRSWDRPLTAYYLILGASPLITALGLVMVFSASEIQALRYGLPSTFYFRKQLLAAAIGTGLLLAAWRMPPRLHQALAYPLLCGSVLLLVLVQIPGIGETVNGNTN